MLKGARMKKQDEEAGSIITNNWEKSEVFKLWLKVYDSGPGTVALCLKSNSSEMGITALPEIAYFICNKFKRFSQHRSICT